MYTEITLESYIDDCELSVRATNALSVAGFNQLKELVDYPRSKLKSFRNVGNNTIEEISRLLSKFGASLDSYSNNELETLARRFKEIITVVNGLASRVEKLSEEKKKKLKGDRDIDKFIDRETGAFIDFHGNKWVRAT